MLVCLLERNHVFFSIHGFANLLLISLVYELSFVGSNNLCFPSFFCLVSPFFKIYVLLFKYSFLHFPTNASPAPPTPTSQLQSYPQFGFVHGSFIQVSWWSFPIFLLLSPYPLPPGHCQFVLYFNVSGSVLLACLFCWLGSPYRWDHMVFVFHLQAYFT